MNKICKCCGQEKAIEHFGRSYKGYSLGSCKKCESTKRKQWNIDNPEKHTLQIQKQIEKAKQRRREVGGENQ